MGAECSTNEENGNTHRNLIARSKRKSVLEFILVYWMMILKYILKRWGKYELDSSISEYGRVGRFCENGQEPYDFRSNNEFLDRPKYISFSRKPLLHDVCPYLNENTFLVTYKTNCL